MDVVTHYSPPLTSVSPTCATTYQSARRTSDEEKQDDRLSIPLVSATGSQTTNSQSETITNAGTEQTLQSYGVTSHKTKAVISTTFNRAVEISLMEPVGSMSLSPANRDVVLAARKGLFILDLENPYDQPRFLPHLTTWVPADVQWNPHPARANWVASTSNNKLLVWNLDRPAAHRPGPILSVPNMSGTNTGSSATSLNNATPSTLPHPFSYTEGTVPTVSQSSSISHVLNAHTRAITDINWSPFHPEILASCGIDTWMWSWDLREPSRPKQGYSAWNAAMTQVKWNRASPHRLATSCDNKVLIWDDRGGALPLATIEAAQSRVYGIDWSRDTSSGLSRLITCSLDGSVKWWDLDSPAAQNAIGERRLVTEEEAIIETHTPVWRARHLPFGNGVMTLPQRGDYDLCMWAKDKPDEPIHRFEGHRDVVKEYLIRSQGGNDRERDDRRFQLITWSKDQTLRLWPISEDLMKAVGHHRDTPIRVLQTRIGAPDVTYRVPPERATGPITMPVVVSPGVSVQSPPSNSASPTLFPPAEATRSMLSISAKMSDRLGSRYGSSIRLGSSFNQRDASVDRKYGLSGSQGTASYNERNHRKSIPTNHLTSSKDKRSVTMLSEPQVISRNNRKNGRTTLEPPLENLGFFQERVRREDYRAEKRERQRKRQEIASSRAASNNYMTRGNGGQTGQGRYFVGGRLNKGASRRGAALDAVGWIAGVQMGQEENDLNTSSAAADGEPVRGVAYNGSEGEEQEMHLNAGQVLGEEIKAVSRNVTGVAFEKIDVSTRTCTVTCYGPWAGKSVACFLRIAFIFPINYPAKAPRFELEHNASVPLKTRAFLLRKVTSILSEATQRRPAEPSMEECIRFLQGELLDDEVLGGSSGLQDFWLPGDDSDEDEVRPSMLKMVPRTSGVSFGPNGQLVIFSPSINTADAATPSAAMAAEMGSTLGGLSIEDDSQALKSRGARFLQSYTALSGAMNSLARLAKEGMAVQELDVVSLMANQSFFINRIQKQHHRPPASELTPSSRNRERSAAHQDRLSYIRSSVSRTPSRSRSNRRTRSASPMPRLGHEKPIKSLRTDVTKDGNTLKNRSRVCIYDLKEVISPLSMLTPPFSRKRSSSMPSTPTSLTPKQEDITFQLSTKQNALHRKIPAMPDGIKSSDEDSDDSDSQYGESDSEEEPDATALLRASQRDAMSPIVEQILDTIIWTVPFGFLFLMMDIMIQQQYGINPPFFGELSQIASPLLILTAFIFNTAIRPFTSHRLVLQAFMFSIGTLCGICFLYIYSRSAMDIVVRRIPPLAVLWMYSIVRMDLSLLLLSLSIVWGFVIYYDLPVFS